MSSSALRLIDDIVLTRTRIDHDPPLLARLTALQQWQAARLRSTYADCAASEKYAAALDFFVHDLYGTREFSQRYADLARVLRQWQRLLPRHALQAVACALELEALTQELDLALLAALGDTTLTCESYARAYRGANRREDRLRQLRLILAAGRALGSLMKGRGVGAALRAARIPARVLGVTVLHEFLERGYAAFRRMGNADELLRIIKQREAVILQRLFAGSSDPFRVVDPPQRATSRP